VKIAYDHMEEDPVTKQMERKYKIIYVTIESVFEHMVSKDYVELDPSITENRPAQIEKNNAQVGKTNYGIPLGRIYNLFMCTEKLDNPNCKIDVYTYKVNSYYPHQPSFMLLPIARFKNQFDRYVATLEPLQIFTDIPSNQITKTRYVNIIFKPNVRNVNGKSLAEASNDYRTLVRNNHRDSQNYRLFEPFYKPPC
jgi:hypothetical protein